MLYLETFSWSSSSSLECLSRSDDSSLLRSSKVDSCFRHWTCWSFSWPFIWNFENALTSCYRSKQCAMSSISFFERNTRTTKALFWHWIHQSSQDTVVYLLNLVLFIFACFASRLQLRAEILHCRRFWRLQLLYGRVLLLHCRLELHTFLLQLVVFFVLFFQAAFKFCWLFLCQVGIIVCL